MLKSFDSVVWLLVALSGIALAANTIEDSSPRCDYSPVEVIFLVDITSTNKTNFKVQQQRLLRTLKHIDTAAVQRRHRFSVVAFHSNPTTLLELGSPFSNDSDRISSVISTLRPRQFVQTSVAKAFDAAAFQFKQYGDPDAKRVVLLAHDGMSTDRVAETVDAATSIKELGVQVFALSGNPLSNSLALLGYTGERERLLINADDTQEFHAMLDDAIGVCGKSRIISRKAKGVRIGRAEGKPKVFEDGLDCGHGKLDLMIVLDTSGSVFTVFEDQRKIALDILNSFPQSAYDDRLQISVVRFASSAEVLIPFKLGRSKGEMREEIKAIRFTGENTRIASAIDMAIEEVERAKRKDATQVLVLISDGHGQEYWNVVQTTGKRLQETGIETFAVSAGYRYSETELLIYVGHRSRLFVGARYTGFLPTIISYISGCVGPSVKGAEEGAIDESKEAISSTFNGNKDLSASSKIRSGFFGGRNGISLKTTTTTIEPATSDAKTKEDLEGQVITTSGSSGNEETPESTTAGINLQNGATKEPEDSTNAATITSEANEDFSFFSQSTADGRGGKENEKKTTSVALTFSTPDDVEGSGLAESKTTTAETTAIEGSGEQQEGRTTITETTTIESLNLDPELLSSTDRQPRKDEVEVVPADKNTEKLRLRDAGQFGALLCDIDLALIVDRSTSVVDDFEREIHTALQIVNLFSEKDYENSRIRVGAVSFAKDARLELSLSEHKRKEVFDTIEKIEHTGGSTSAVEGAKLAMTRLLSNRRPSARLIILLLTDGHSQDYWRHLVETSMKIRETPNSILLAFTASNYFSRSELQAWTGDKKRVFLNNEEDLFLNAMRENIRKCKETETFDEKTGELESVARKEGADSQKEAATVAVEEQTTRAELESTTIAERLDNEKEEVVESTTTGESAESAEGTTVGETQTTEEERKTTVEDTDLVGNTQTPEVPEETTEKVEKRDDVTGENSVRIAEGAESTTAESVTAVEESAEKLETTTETQTTAGTSENVETVLTTESAETTTLEESTTIAESTDSQTTGEGAEKKDGLEITKEAELPEDEKKLVKLVGRLLPTDNTTTEPEEPKAHGIRTVNDISDKDSSSLVEKASIGTSSCLVDLIFVIDISTSVEAEFQRQLQFAVDLVKRLPTEDFEKRVKVGVVLFNWNATMYLSLGKISSRSSILDALLAIENTGGSTSVASGISMAVNEIEKRKRPNARQMIVLVSDGNSQDLWDDVIRTSNRLRTTGADVYAVTVSQKYMFRELELYAGDKWRVYIDARIRQFLDEAEHSVMQCGPATKSNEEKEQLSTIHEPPACESDPVDVILALDTTATETIFFQERQFAEDLIKSLPKFLFEKRVSLAIIPFADTAEVASQLGSTLSRGDVIYELERIQNVQKSTTANYSALVEEISEELSSRRRSNARVIVVLITDGGMKEDLSDVQNAFETLGQHGAEVFAVATADQPNMTALEAMVADEKRIFASSRLDRFVQEVGAAIIKCVEQREETPKQTIKPIAKVPRETDSTLIKLKDPESSNKIDLSEEDFKNCKYKKMDLQIILDASSSREEVFEAQRELALSLIEKLPISSDGTHVAVGINSFTSVPTLRQTLGLGREKKIVRSAIEGIAYTGGSTLTAQAVELSVEDLERGRRKDAIQVVILMNDGISQDTWERVQEASKKLEATGAERFGIALGQQVDLRELNLYVGKAERIYRDGETEKLLRDVIALLQKNCSMPDPNDVPTLPNPILREEPPADCAHPNVDLVVLFDNTDKSGNNSDPVVNANRYLLLDVLGSLSNSSHVRVSVISFSKKPRVELDFTNISERDLIFAQVEAIKAVAGMPSYAEAVKLGLDVIDRKRRHDAKATMIIVGDGTTTKDTREETNAISKRIRETPRLSCLAVDSSTRTDIRSLKTFTGRREHVFDYERNALFAEEVKRMARKPNLENCPQLAILDVGKRARAAVTVSRVDGEQIALHRDEVYSTIGPINEAIDSELDEVKRDLSTLTLDSKLDDGKFIVPKKKEELAVEKIVEEDVIPTTKRHRTLPTTQPPRPTTPTGFPQNIRIRVQTTESAPNTTLFTGPTIPTTTPSFFPLFRTRPTFPPVELPTTFKPGCEMDVIIVLDSSGSVEETFRREKELAAGVIDLFRIGPDNARVCLIKFAAPQKVKTIWSFGDVQSRIRILRALHQVPFSSGTTAIHSAILRAVSEYTEERGARPGRAIPVAILFTDGFGQRSAEKEGELLRKLIPHTYAVAINHQYPISRSELVRITGDEKRVYTDANIKDFHAELKSLTTDCVIDD